MCADILIQNILLSIINDKGIKFTPEHAMKAQTGSRIIALSLTLVLERVGVQRHVPAT
jgi:hypothetical protein